MTEQNEPAAQDMTLTDAAAISAEILEYEELQLHLHRAIDESMAPHDDRWAGMGPDLILVFADNPEELVSKLRPDGDSNRPVAIEHLASDPMELIL